MSRATAPATTPDGAAAALPPQRRLGLRWPTVVALALWAAASAVLALTTVPATAPRAGLFAGGEDLWVYREAARNVTAHLDLYILPVLGEHFYTYPPFSAIAFLPIGLLPGGLDKHLWLGMNVVVLVAVVMLCWRLLGYRITGTLVAASALLAIGFVFVEPVRTTLFYGQINLVLLLLVLCDNACRPRAPFKGLGAGLAAGIKLTPAYFVVYYLTIRQWRAAIVAVGAFAATIGVGWLVLPRDSREYWGGMFLNTSRVAEDQLHPSNQSLRGTLGRLLSGHPTSVVEPLAGKPAPVWLWLALTGMVLAVSMWLAVRLYRIGERLLSVSVTGLTATVVSPFSWTHHWVWVLPVMVYVVHRATASGWWWPAAAALFAILGAWPYRFPADEQPRTGLYMFPDKWVPWECLANLYLLLYAAIMIGAAMIAYRRPARVDRGEPDAG